MKKRTFLIIVTFCISAFYFTSCQENADPKFNSTPTSGKIKISADESVQMLIDSQISTFSALYKYAEITPLYRPENDVVTDLMNDSVPAIVLCRKLTEAETQKLRDSSVIARATLVAFDAIAFITNVQNPDSFINFEVIRNIFVGKIKNWDEINPKSKLGAVNVVFDNYKSANVRYLREKFNISQKFGDNFFAQNNSPEVINYVERNKNAIGVISLNWVSDIDDPSSIDFLKRIKVVAVSSEIAPNINEYFRPYQGTLALKQYPFMREVYVISRESYAGLGSGFASFVAGENGQRIVRMSGLLPANMPIRLMQTKKNF